MTQLNHADLLVQPGCTVHLSDFNPASTGDFKNKQHAREKLRADIARLAALQDMLFAQGRYALLIISEHGWCGEGWRDQARDDGGQSAGHRRQ